jgi:hypothetical protein
MYNPMYEPDKHLPRRGAGPLARRGCPSTGISRAALIRRLIDRGLDQTDSDLESDLAAIEASFNVLSDEENFLERGTDDRSRHLDNVRGGR